MKSYLFLLCALLAVAAEPVRTVSDDEAFAALQGIVANQPVKEQALYCRALGLFHNALSNPRNKFAQRPEFAAVLDKVKASPVIAVGPGKPLLHFKQNQMGALRILLDQSGHPERLRADHLTKHPSADLYPGAVSTNAPRLTESVFLNIRSVGWLSTGLYAPAGEKITLTIPAELVNKGAKVRIGANTAELYVWSEARRSLGRFPKVDGEMPLTQTVTEFGNSFGGPIYIDLPDNGQGIDRVKADINGLVGTYSYPETQIAKFTFAGVVKMPYFLPGRTSVEEWRKTIRNYPAPVAELGTYKIIFTIPAQYIRNLDDPTVPLAVWDNIQNANAELCGRPFTRPMPIRIAIDAQVKWGEAYATYPICAPFYWTPPIVEGKPGWGHVHEIGHLHQKTDWTFQGCGEVTVNLFSMYALEKVMGDTGRRQQEINSPRQIKKWLKLTPAERDWTKNGDVWSKLGYYAELADGFGWEPMKKTLLEYRTKPFHGSDVERAGEFILRYSKHTGKNLAPFSALWGIQFPPAIADQLKDLPVWFPANIPASALKKP